MKLFRLRFFRLFRSGCDDVKHVRMGRTMESTIFELVALVLVVTMLVLAVIMYFHAPETIPTHFDAAGHPNNEGSRLTLLIVAGVGSILTVLFMVGAYVPTGVINPPPNLETPRQFVLASRMVRVLALLLCLLFICIILMMCYPTAGCGIPLIILVISIALTPVVFAIFIRRARNR
ncbi:MAG: DUF1648 domain-containing protein [Prevotella sp.]|nr:DUF1648 domain-containing protein [Prevotella sp.]